MAIEFTIGAEEIHKIGEEGAKRIRRWLDSTVASRSVVWDAVGRNRRDRDRDEAV